MLIGWSYLIISIPRVCFCFYRIYIKSVLSCWSLRQQISHLVSPTTNIPPAFSANIYKSSLDFVAVHILDTFKEAFKLVDKTFTTNDYSNQFTLKTFISYLQICTFCSMIVTHWPCWSSLFQWRYHWPFKDPTVWLE